MVQDDYISAAFLTWGEISTGLGGESGPGYWILGDLVPSYLLNSHRATPTSVSTGFQCCVACSSAVYVVQQNDHYVFTASTWINQHLLLTEYTGRSFNQMHPNFPYGPDKMRSFITVVDVSLHSFSCLVLCLF